jgi:transposase
VKKIVNRIDPHDIPNKEFGASKYLLLLGNDISTNLEKYFPDLWKEIIVMAVLRTYHPQPFKQIEASYIHSFLSVDYPDLSLNKQRITEILKLIGNRRIDIVKFMKEYVQGAEHIIFDGTRITSYSEKMDISQIGYNNKRSYDPQVNLLYAFSTRPDVTPAYYRVLPGNICDVSAFSKSVEEAGLQDALIIGDKGFGSKDNFNALEEAGLKYIVPLKRSSSHLDIEKLRAGHANGFDNYFLFNGRPIFFFSHKEGEITFATFLDGELHLREETDYIRRIEEKKEGYTKESFAERRLKFGVFLLRSNAPISPREIYETYKTRAMIEESFDTLKNLLMHDTSYMQSDQSFEAWAFLNHISLMLSYRLWNVLKTKELFKSYSSSDVLLLLSFVRKLYINDEWVFSEICKKSRTLLEDLDFDVKS